MEINNCAHSTLDDGYCTECGILINNEIYEKNVIYKKNYSDKIYNKYSVKLFNLTEDEKILNKMIEIFKIKNYKAEILDQLKNKKFSYKLNKKNKILLIILNILKNSKCPISINDILPYTEMKKSKFLKIYRNSFLYTKLSQEYYINIYQRVIELLKEYNLKTELKIDIFIKYSKILNTVDIFTLCKILMFYFSNKKIFKEYKFESNLEKNKYRKIYNKIKTNEIKKN